MTFLRRKTTYKEKQKKKDHAIHHTPDNQTFNIKNPNHTTKKGWWRKYK